MEHRYTFDYMTLYKSVRLFNTGEHKYIERTKVSKASWYSSTQEGHTIYYDRYIGKGYGNNNDTVSIILRSSLRNIYRATTGLMTLNYLQ